MSALNNQNLQQDALVASLAAKYPGRHFQRSLIEPANETRERLLAGVVCVVAEGGGNFANYHGREGAQGTCNVRLVGFLLVEDNTAPVAIEMAELLLLKDLLAWLSNQGDRSLLGPVDVIYPGDWHCSRQIEHPYGWVTLALDVR